jgi:hypothetical protein
MVLEKLLDYEENFMTFFEEPKILSNKGHDGETMLGTVVAKIE